MTPEDPLRAGQEALAEGRWTAAVAAFEAVQARTPSGPAGFGLASALWWLGDNERSVAECTRAYALFRRASEVAGAVQCAVWLCITYKANFANFVAAGGWIARADRLLAGSTEGSLHGWARIARAYRMPELEQAERLTTTALQIARTIGDVDLELVSTAQLGLIRVGRGEPDGGFTLLDEAMAAALGGERSSLDTVVYTCCDMLNACELASDMARALQWCRVADEFVRTYGCPFLYAECRIFYGGVLAAKGRWADAERELDAGRSITASACPGLHARALTRLGALRVRQGRLEEAEQLLARAGDHVEAEAETALAAAALLLARGDAHSASAALEQRMRHLPEHRLHLATALDLLVDATLTTGDIDAATAAADRLDATAAGNDQLGAVAAAARGRVALARGETGAGAEYLSAALRTWSRLEIPFETARTRFDLGRALANDAPRLAIEHARRALTTFDDLGATGEADRVAAFLRSTGVIPRTGPKGVGVLTAREQEVLGLLGAGLSNPEIAQRLHVSRKTAAHHVSNILGKLNLRSRAEAAAYAATRSPRH